MEKVSVKRFGNKWVIHIVVLAMISYGVASVNLASSCWPCGVAMMGAALRKDSLYLYLSVPAGVAFVITYVKSSGTANPAGDFFAFMICTLLFMTKYGKGIDNFSRMIICAGVSLITNITYFVLSDMIYRIDVVMLVFECIAIGSLYYVFHVFFELIDWKREYKGESESAIVAVSIIISLTLAGLFQGAGETGEIAANSGVLLMILVLGYKLGIYAGIASGAVSAIALCLAGMLYSSQVIIFVCAGFTAGFFSGLNRATTGMCFAATCLVFGLVFKGSLGGFSSLPPLLAAGMFMIAPKSISFAVTRLLRRVVHDDEKISDVRTEEILEVIEGYRKCFYNLGQLYKIGKDGRSIVSQQFRGLERVLEKLENDIKLAENGRISPVSSNGDTRYRLETQVSGYARNGNVSGDSYICRRLKDNKYIMILCDGMGKGEAAAIESNLAVKTLSNLIDAGFETELAIHTLNTILLLKSHDEIFSTVDIGIFDCDKASLKLYKIGAASTFVKRGSRVDAVKMAALPMGIVDGLKIDYVDLKLKEGDQIIMVSDGVTDSGRFIEKNMLAESEWLKEIILGVKSKDPGTMADLIMSSAIENYGVRERDDLTVISAVVKAKC